MASEEHPANTPIRPVRDANSLLRAVSAANPYISTNLHVVRTCVAAPSARAAS